MSSSAARAASLPTPAALIGACVLVAIAVATTALAVLVSDISVVAGIVPIVIAIALWIVWVAPLRRTLIVLIFLGLSLDKPGDTEGLWHSPLSPLGGLLLNNMNKTVNVPPLAFSLLVAALGYLLLIHAYRVLFRPRTEAVPPANAKPMTLALAISFLTAVALCFYGIARGGDGQMAKIQLQVFIPLLATAYLLGVALRGTCDYRTLGKAIVGAACVKALVAVWIRLTLPVVFGEGRGQLAYATTHGDSMLFASAVAILVGTFFERPTRRNLWLLLTVMPVLMAGMLANNRRLVWVQVAASIIVLLVMNPRGRATRGLVRAVTYGLPILLLYVGIGWNSGAKIFAPVRTLRSMSDSNIDRSTLYRDGENYNLVYTFRESPVVGSGFGHPFELAVQLDDISRGFREWRYLPHNSILGLWAFTGGLGFTGLWTAIFAGLMLAARSYEFSVHPDQRTAAAAAMGGIVIYMIHCWGDIGFTEQKSIFLVGSALAVAGQLAVATGAWRLNANAVRQA